MGLDDCAVGRGILRGHRVVVGVFGRSDLGPALHGVAGNDDWHVAAELGPGYADGQKRKGADDHDETGNHLHLDGNGDHDVCTAVAVGVERKG